MLLIPATRNPISKHVEIVEMSLNCMRAVGLCPWTLCSLHERGNDLCLVQFLHSVTIKHILSTLFRPYMLMNFFIGQQRNCTPEMTQAAKLSSQRGTHADKTKSSKIEAIFILLCSKSASVSAIFFLGN